jgi:hypothetical protein
MRSLIDGLSGWAYTRYSESLVVQAVDVAITAVGAGLLVLTLVMFLRG